MISNDNPVHSEHDFSVTVYYELYRRLPITNIITNLLMVTNY